MTSWLNGRTFAETSKPSGALLMLLPSSPDFQGAAATGKCIYYPYSGCKYFVSNKVIV
jgi:hypothetical protein